MSTDPKTISRNAAWSAHLASTNWSVVIRTIYADEVGRSKMGTTNPAMRAAVPGMEAYLRLPGRPRIAEYGVDTAGGEASKGKVDKADP